MAFDYKQYFGDIVVAQDLVTRPEERTWRLAPPPATPSTTTSCSTSAATCCAPPT